MAKHFICLSRLSILEVYVLRTSQQVVYLQTETFFQLQKNIEACPKKGGKHSCLKLGLEMQLPKVHVSSTPGGIKTTHLSFFASAKMHLIVNTIVLY